MKITKTLCLTVLCLFALTLNAKLHVPELTSRVVDNMNLLTAAQKADVELTIKQLEDDTGGQMAVLIIPSLEGDNLEEFSMRVAEKWQIGYKGKDNGVILLISQADRKIRLEVGAGWNGLINNNRAKTIINEMGPFFRDGKFAAGMINAINSVNNLVSGKKNVTKPKTVKTFRPSTIAWIKIGGYFTLFLFIFILFLCFKSGGGSDGYSYGNNGGGRAYGAHYHSSSSLGSGSGGSNGGFGGSSGFSGGGGGFSGGGASGGW